MSQYLYGIGGGVIVTLLVLVWFQRIEIRHLERSAAELRSNLATVSIANANQKHSIDQLESANALWAGKAGKQHQEYLLTLADLTRANVKRQELESKLLQAEAGDKLLPACKSLLDADLGEICPAIEAAAQERAK